MKRVIVAGLMVLAWQGSAMSAEMKIKASAAVQVGKDAAVATQGNVDEAFVRGETKFSGTLEKGASALIHVRLQSDFADNKNTSVKIRQCLLTLPAGLFTVQGGRWYESYTPGYYFGRFHFGVKKEVGSGSMNTDYTVVDGVRLQAGLEDSGPHTARARVYQQAQRGRYACRSGLDG
ncbi:MAG: hypothetical protein GF331_23835, partial [Chitinivibrionales bacterium]|nr:hypothetical protein [Chitinivibrionales bacterium]